MKQSEEIDLRQGLVNDPAALMAFDSSFWHGDTANLVFDTTRNSYKVGDSGLVGAVSSRSQYLYGDFEFSMTVDSLSPDSNDGASATQGKRWGLQNVGDTLERGAAYFEMRFDSVTGGDTLTIRPLRAVIRDEQGVKQQKNITWDTRWGDSDASVSATRYRIKWESDNIQFLINDSIVATLGDRPDSSNRTFQINTSIPQALRIVNRTVDTTDSAAMSMKLLVVRNARMINPRLML